ncbi:hypothetical protein EMIT0158MI4_140131 [Burkholderia ambifaria]
MFAWQRPMPARQVTQPAPAARSGGGGLPHGHRMPVLAVTARRGPFRQTRSAQRFPRLDS